MKSVKGNCYAATIYTFPSFPLEALTIDLFPLTAFLFLFARRNLECSMLGGKVSGQVKELGCKCNLVKVDFGDLVGRFMVVGMKTTEKKSNRSPRV